MSKSTEVEPRNRMKPLGPNPESCADHALDCRYRYPYENCDCGLKNYFGENPDSRKKAMVKP